MHIFDHTVKPVLLYASEIVGLFSNNKNVGVNSNNESHFISNLYSRNPLEKLNICLPQQGVMMSVFAQPDPVFDHGNNSVNI
jgi:hypothetical protein